MAKLLRILCLLASLVTSISAIDYCNVESCMGNPHIMCKSTALRYNQVCGQLKTSGLTAAEKNNILDIHNELRVKVASGSETRGNPGPQPAGKISSLVWDDDLAAIAQTWANHCIINGRQNTCRNTDRFVVGMNVGSRDSVVGWTGTVTDLVVDWYNQVDNFDSNDVKSFPIKPRIGVYTQLVWGKTTHIGCGLAKFKKGISFKTVLVCDYGPAGNQVMNDVGLPVYETAKKNPSTVDYCSMDLCNGNLHTMCKFKSTIFGKKCGRMGPSRLTQLEMREIVDVHNKFRAKVAQGQENRGNPGPQPAGKLPPLKWDIELAAVAQIWANQCELGRSDVCRTLPRFEVGQNTVTRTESNNWTTSMTELITDWYENVKNFNSNEVKSFRLNPKISTYTQMVWGKTTHIGCGLVRFKDGRNFKTSLICNYGSSNNRIPNFVGSPVYEINQVSTPTTRIPPKSPVPAHPVDYCNIESCGKRLHTMCKFRSPKPGKSCAQMGTSYLTDSEITEIVDIHNKFRRKVASGNEHRGRPGPQPAGKIPPLTWDDELATISQRWANQCTFGHDTCRNTARFSVGQNSAITGWSDKWRVSVADLITNWYNEVEIFDSNRVKNFRFNQKTGHYTQLVWGKTTHIGCGIARFKEDIYFQTFLVCNYGPAGNLELYGSRLPIYETNQ